MKIFPTFIFNPCAAEPDLFLDCVFRAKSATDSGMKSATHSDLKSATPERGGKRSTAGWCSALCSSRQRRAGGPMPAERMSMRRVREILRLKHECGATDRAIARSLSIARSTVALTLERRGDGAALAVAGD